jgi:DNA-binding beta-propeller fold protein YncE
VRKLTPEGRVLLTIGVPGRPSQPMSGRPFNRCTHTALSPGGEIYVSDGYENAAVHRFAPDGVLLASWGGSGVEPGAFNVPHNIVCDGDGWVYVADRENHRIQVFDGTGRFEAQWNNLHRPCALCLDARRSQFCIGEAGPGLEVNRHHPGLGPRVSFVAPGGGLLARLGDNGYGQRPDQFVAPHGIAVDSRGDLYVGEVANVAWQGTFPGRPTEGPLRTLRKLRRLPPAGAGKLGNQALG